MHAFFDGRSAFRIILSLGIVFFALGILVVSEEIVLLVVNGRCGTIGRLTSPFISRRRPSLLFLLRRRRFGIDPRINLCLRLLDVFLASLEILLRALDFCPVMLLDGSRVVSYLDDTPINNVTHLEQTIRLIVRLRSSFDDRLKVLDFLLVRTQLLLEVEQLFILLIEFIFVVVVIR